MGAGDRDRDHQPPDGQPPRSRLEDEVREILVRADQPTSLRDHVRRRAARPPRGRGGGGPPWSRLDRLGSGGYWIASLGAAFVGALVHGTSPLLGTLCGVVSAVSFGMLWRRGGANGYGSPGQHWRGRDLGPNPTTPAWVESLRDRFRGPPRR